MLHIEPLGRHHAREQFDCGVEPLNIFLRQIARQHQDKGISRTFVLVEDTDPEPKIISGFFTLAATEAVADRLPPHLASRFPARIPAVTLARLAVSKSRHGQGLGSVLIAEALSRVAAIAQQLGVAGLFVDAKDGAAACFYRKHGFLPLVSDPLRLFLPLATIQRFLAH